MLSEPANPYLHCCSSHTAFVRATMLCAEALPFAPNFEQFSSQFDTISWNSMLHTACIKLKMSDADSAIAAPRSKHARNRQASATIILGTRIRIRSAVRISAADETLMVVLFRMPFTRSCESTRFRMRPLQMFLSTQTLGTECDSWITRKCAFVEAPSMLCCKTASLWYCVCVCVESFILMMRLLRLDENVFAG